MLDNIRIAMERQISRENSTVKSASVANRIKREGEKQGSKQNFKDEMNKKTLKNSGNTISVDAVKEPVEEDIIVSKSLNKTMEEQRKIAELVNEKFVENLLLKGKIDFDK